MSKTIPIYSIGEDGNAIAYAVGFTPDVSKWPELSALQIGWVVSDDGSKTGRVYYNLNEFIIRGNPDYDDVDGEKEFGGKTFTGDGIFDENNSSLYRSQSELEADLLD